jgi:hypothetical protein
VRVMKSKPMTKLWRMRGVDKQPVPAPGRREIFLALQEAFVHPSK